MTSNPTIFQAAIAEGDAYDEQIKEVSAIESEPKEIFLALARDDIRAACDVLRPSGTTATAGTAGSRSRSTRTSRTTRRRTIDEAKRLHALVDRPNLLIKIPATPRGPARDRGDDRGRHPGQRDADLLARAPPRGGRGVRPRPASAWSTAAATRREIASVASFFVSRVDTEADKRLDEIGGHDELKGTLAIANAKLAYVTYEEVFSGADWDALAAKGATPQRCLWASTSTKNPDYRDVIYVEELIGPDTVNTMPRETIEAFQDHGDVERTLDRDVDGARRIARGRSRRPAIDYDDVVETLEREGVEKFAKSFRELFADLEAKRDALVAA